MSSVKVAITIDSGVLNRLDALVAHGHFPSRSGARLDRRAEQALADESSGEGGNEWPEY